MYSISLALGTLPCWGGLNPGSDLVALVLIDKETHVTTGRRAAMVEATYVLGPLL